MELQCTINPFTQKTPYWTFLTEVPEPVPTWQKISFFKQPNKQLNNSMEQSPSRDTSTPRLVKKFRTLYQTQRYIPTFTSTCHLSLSWARSIQSVPPLPTSCRYIFMLFYHLCLDVPNGLLSLRSPYQNSVCTWHVNHSWYMSCSSHYSWFYHPNNISWGVQIWNLWNIL
jgi:hypothetical protein